MGVLDTEGWATRTAAIVEVARLVQAAGPAPRGRPFFGIDRQSPTPLALVDELATRGIFRKYEHVLDLGGGIGGTTRYMASRLGCTATATARTSAEASAGRALTSRAALDWHVFHTAADPTSLPYSAAAFTHVWIVDALPALGPSAAVLAEAFRVLRPGGHLGIQELVTRGGAPSSFLGHVDAETRRAELERAGFVEIVRRDVDGELPSDTTQGRAAWRRLARRLGPDDAFVRDRHALETALASGHLAIVQLTARRP